LRCFGSSLSQGHAELYKDGGLEEEDESSGLKITLAAHLSTTMGGSPEEDAADEEPNYIFVTSRYE
jgi:hypothetical protein